MQFVSYLDDERIIGGEEDLEILPHALTPLLRAALKHATTTGKSKKKKKKIHFFKSVYLKIIFFPSFKKKKRNWSLEEYGNCGCISEFLGGNF